MTSAISRTSVVVTTHDRPAGIQRLLDSLATCPGGFELIVVDDGSEPPVHLEAKQAQLVRLDGARLVSAARNEGASIAHGDILIFIDDDCVVDKFALNALIRALEAEGNVGIAGPVIAYASDPERVWCAGVDRTKLLSRTRMRGRGQRVSELLFLRRDCGDFPAAFAVRRSCFEEVGGFDEANFPMHMEEADLAARIRRNGYRVVVAPDAIVWHDIDPRSDLFRTLHLISKPRAYLVGRSRGLFLRRHIPDRGRLTLALGFWLLVLVPLHIAVILSHRFLSLRQRLDYLRIFTSGVWHGLVMPV